MRVRAAMALGLLMLVGSAACGGGGSKDEGVASVDSGKPKASAAAGGKGSATDFAKCMRENGVPEFPDPEANGSMVLPEGVDKNKVDQAQEKCKSKMPDGGDRPKMSSDDIEKMRKFAQCMRENGISSFPDPDPASGGMVQNGELDPEDPKFKAAEDKCRQYQPEMGTGAETGTRG